MFISRAFTPLHAGLHAGLLPLAISLCLGGCASRNGPPPGGANSKPASSGSWPEKDGPGASPPANLHLVPNASPQLESIRKGGPNKPYEVLGERYEPETGDVPLVQRGLASWYGNKFHGRPTASGEVYNMYAMTAAHATMPIPSYARVRNPGNGREVIVRINDRGPFHKGRVIDLSYTAALKLGVLHGVSTVEVSRITYEDIRSGKWQGEDGKPADTPVFAATEAVGAPQAPSTATLALAGSLPAPVTAPSVMPAKAAPGFWVQFGAFSKLAGAESFRQKLVQEADWMAPLLAVFKDNNLHRLQAGPYASREDAGRAAERVRLALAVQGVVLERR
nr:septal ring lytic transglycosylase RlpA family protein [uncultured Roseateles sp.]